MSDKLTACKDCKHCKCEVCGLSSPVYARLQNRNGDCKRFKLWSGPQSRERKDDAERTENA